MTRRPRKNLPQAHLSRLTKKRDKTYYEDRYKAVFKVATLAANVSKEEKGKRGNGVDSICQRVNDEMLTSPANRKLRPSTLHCAVQRGEFGILRVRSQLRISQTGTSEQAANKQPTSSQRLLCFLT
jgi:hypothetical protein